MLKAILATCFLLSTTPLPMANTLPSDRRGRVLVPVALDGGVDPAVLGSYGDALERAVAVAVRTGQSGLLERADRLAEVIGGSVEPNVALLEDRLHRLKTMRAVFEQGDWLTTEQLRDLQPVPPASPSLPASDWKRRGRIYGVSYRGRELYARYQFDEMYQPLAVVKEVLKAFGPVADPWLLAAWFHFPNGWLAGPDGRPMAPKDALDCRDALLAAAARRQGSYVA